MTPRTAPSFLALIALSSSSALAGGTISQEVPFHFDVQEVNARVPITFDRFDDLGGQRTLTNIFLSMDTDYTLRMLVENGEDFPITTDDWFFEAVIFMDFDIGDEPFATIGADGYVNLTADLAADDGEDLGGPDSVLFEYASNITGTNGVFPSGFGFFEGDGLVEASVYPFLSLAISAPPPFYDLYVLEHIHDGTLTVTYEFEEVPSPGVAMVGALGGVAALRRRRV